MLLPSSGTSGSPSPPRSSTTRYPGTRAEFSGTRALADGSPEPVEWPYTKSEPGRAWLGVEGFDDSAWQVGAGPFFDNERAGWKPIGTTWLRSEPVIWLRHSFEVAQGEELDVPLRVIGRTLGTATVYLNGERLADVTVMGNNSYTTPEVSTAARLRPGRNLLAVEARVSYDSFVDVGLYRGWSAEEMAARLEDRP